MLKCPCRVRPTTSPTSPSKGPAVIRTRAPSRRSRGRGGAPAGSGLPSLPYGTTNCSVRRAAKSGGGTMCRRSSSASSCSTSSILAKMRTAACASIAVCCRLTITAPSTGTPAEVSRQPPRPGPVLVLALLARAAQDSTIRSAFIPASEVPRTSTRSAACSQARRSAKRSLRSSPDIFTTGLDGSNQEPWISFSALCGQPAFCGRPSWFCCTHRLSQPAACRLVNTQWARVGTASNGESIFGAPWSPASELPAREA
mmetsp:Transcript_28307/g.77889  ORF Transcript_28307/g.77889 Transcript_28307/m.77889 type:complete len:256 (+) Transcript_28307:783-1550(+)